jgi:hypothetical protein
MEKQIKNQKYPTTLFMLCIPEYTLLKIKIHLKI